MGFLKSKKNQNKIEAVFEYLIALLLILSVNTVYINMVSINVHLNVIIVVVLFLYILFRIIKYKINGQLFRLKNNFIKSIKYYTFYYLYMCLFVLLNNIMSTNFYSSYFLIMPMFFFIYYTDKGKKDIIFKRIIKIITIISLLSIICYLFIDVFKLINYNNTLYIMWGKEQNINSFLGIHFNTQSFLINGVLFPKNTGIFTEAPMYSLILVLSLAYYEFLAKGKKSIYVRLIIIFTILTTFSTAGYIAVMIIYGFYFLDYIILKMKKSYKRKYKFLIIPILLCILTFSIFLVVKKFNSASGSIRIDDYRACYKTWIDNNFLIGAGYGNKEAIVKNMSEFRIHNKGLSNSFMLVLAEGGIMLFFVFMIPFVYLIYLGYKTKKYNIIYYCLIILFLFVTTIFSHLAIMMNILAIGYSLLVINVEKQKNVRR